MRLSKMFSRTLREPPAEAETAGHQLLVRAGFIRPLGAGIFGYLPLARRVLTKLENILRAEMDALGGQEITLPVVQPAELWKESGRWFSVGEELSRLPDRAGRDLVLALTGEEAVTALARGEIRSYRQLPQVVYQVQTKWRDDPRPRAGLIRVREFTMLDSYSFAADAAGLDQQYQAHYQAYLNIYARCGLPVRAVKADSGMMGGALAHEFMYLTPIGEDTLLLCAACGYAANRQIAGFKKPPAEPEAPRPLEKIATPDLTTIEALAEFLRVPRARTAKAVFMVATLPETEQFVFALVRGDMEVNETKLANVLGARALRPAREAEIRAVGAVPGYASPVGLPGVAVIADEAILTSPNLVAGANEDGYHLLNVNAGRDYPVALTADIAAASAGAACPECGEPLRAERGVEVGNIFKLGTRYSEAMHCTYLTAEGRAQPVVMGSYGIGVGRLLACLAEAHHDEYGLIWPAALAPYLVYLVALKGGAEAAEQVYAALQAAGVEVLYDDRAESPGVKFMDADLIGLPLRLTVSAQSLQQGGVELKRRTEKTKTLVSLADIEARVKAELAADPNE